MKCDICQRVRKQVDPKEWDYIDGKFLCPECLTLKKLFNPVVPKTLGDFKLEPLTVQSSKEKSLASDGQPKYTCAVCLGDASVGIKSPLGNNANFCSQDCFNKYISVFTMRDTDALKQEVPKPAPKHDPVDHPKHYTSHPSGVECIQVTRHMNFNRGNAIKYIWRCGDKGNPIEDLKKAVWYLQDEIKRLENENSKDNT